MTRFLGAMLSLCMAGPAFAQDPVRTIPNAYKVQFENDYVRVVRVRYEAGAKLPEHTHPAGTTVYVYLNDSEGVVFRHVGGSNSAVTRPPVKAGAVRVAAGREEHHTAENNSASATDFLRVFFKTDGSPGYLRHRMPVTDKEYANTQMRITRLRLGQCDAVRVDAKTPVLLIELPTGKERWLDAGGSAVLENQDVRDLDVIRIDFLTNRR